MGVSVCVRRWLHIVVAAALMLSSKGVCAQSCLPSVGSGVPTTLHVVRIVRHCCMFLPWQ
jgi:hypothetical protein